MLRSSRKLKRTTSSKLRTSVRMGAFASIYSPNTKSESTINKSVMFSIWAYHSGVSKGESTKTISRASNGYQNLNLHESDDEATAQQYLPQAVEIARSSATISLPQRCIVIIILHRTFHGEEWRSPCAPEEWHYRSSCLIDTMVVKSFLGPALVCYGVVFPRRAVFGIHQVANSHCSSPSLFHKSIHLSFERRESHKWPFLICANCRCWELDTKTLVRL